MNLAERDADLQLLDRLYTRCASDRGSVVFVNGPVGAGKTALLSAFAERAVARGALFLSVTASGSERHHRFGLADQLVRAMRAAGMAVDPFAAGEFGAAASDEAPGSGPVPFGLLQRICRAVFEFAERAPLVIAVDDVHFADEPSLEVLSYLARRIDSAPVMIVLNECTGHGRALVTLHAETLHLPYCHGVRLARLTAQGVADQLHARLGAAPSCREAELWTRVSGGNPLLLHALIDDRAIGGTAAGIPEPGESYRYAVVRCLHRCAPGMLVAARALAVLGDEASEPLIGELVGGDAILISDSVGGLHTAGLLAASRFRHEQAQLAVLADVPAGELAELHGRAAELLHEGGAPAVAVARQLMAAHDSVRGPWRVDILREAAQEAMLSGEVAEAVGYLRHAYGICSDTTQEAQVTAELADAQWHIDPAKATRHLDQLVRLVHFGLLTGPEALVPVKHLIWWGEFSRADALLKRISAEEDDDQTPAPPGPGRAGVRLIRLALAYCAPELDHDPRAGQHADPLAAMADGTGPLAALTFLDLSAGGTGEGDEVRGADQVLRGTREGSPLAATLLALLLLIRADRLDDAVSWSDRLLGQRWIERVPMRRALLETVRSAAALRRGEPLEAGASARTVLKLVPPASWGVAVGLPLALAIRAGTELGAHDTVQSFLNVPVPPGMFDTPFALPYLQALGRHHLAGGRPHTALTHFRSCGELMARWRIDVPHLVDWRDDAAAALVAMGRVQEARALMEEQLLRFNGGRVPEYFRDPAARSHGPRAATAAVRPRTPQLTPSGPPDRADGPEDPGGAVPGHFGPGPAGEPFPPPGLTEAERRVAALAASGCTNREIAGRLFITMSTVEQHLTKIYRKLRVRGRNDLPSVLQPHSPPSYLANGC
ncbi:helix-turn-helix transcriptional regulator [Streptomyces sp. JNUCC 64]